MKTRTLPTLISLLVACTLCSNALFGQEMFVEGVIKVSTDSKRDNNRFIFSDVTFGANKGESKTSLRNNTPSYEVDVPCMSTTLSNCISYTNISENSTTDKFCFIFEKNTSKSIMTSQTVERWGNNKRTSTLEFKYTTYGYFVLNSSYTEKNGREVIIGNLNLPSSSKWEIQITKEGGASHKIAIAGNNAITIGDIKKEFGSNFEYGKEYTFQLVRDNTPVLAARTTRIKKQISAVKTTTIKSKRCGPDYHTVNITFVNNNMNGHTLQLLQKNGSQISESKCNGNTVTFKIEDKITSTQTDRFAITAADKNAYISREVDLTLTMPEKVTVSGKIHIVKDKYNITEARNDSNHKDLEDDVNVAILTYSDSNYRKNISILTVVNKVSIYNKNNDYIILTKPHPALSSIAATTGWIKTQYFGKMKSDTSYKVNFYDGDGCFLNTVEYNLTKPDPIAITDYKDTIYLCNSTGNSITQTRDVKFKFHGPLGPFTALLMHAHDTIGTLTIDDTEILPSAPKQCEFKGINLTPGNYKIIVNGRYKMTQEVNFYVDTLPKLQLAQTITQPKCNNQTGEILFNTNTILQHYAEVTSSGYYMKNNSTGNFEPIPTNPLTGIEEGDYTFSYVYNESYCADTFTVAIKEPAPIGINFSHRNIARYGDTTGVISVVLSGGTPPYSIYASGGNLLTEQDEFITLSDDKVPFSNLAEGTYTFTVKDAHECRAEASQEILQPDAPLTLVFNKDASSTNIRCHGDTTGELYVAAQGGWGDYTYTFRGIENRNGVFKNLKATTTPEVEMIYVKDNYRVTDSIDIRITEPLPLRANIIEKQSLSAVACHNDSTAYISCEVSGGIEPYRTSTNGEQWLHSTELSHLPAQEYTIYVQDSNNCEVNLHYSVSQPPAITIQLTAEHTFCEQSIGSIAATVAGGTGEYTYRWLQNTDTLTTIYGASADQLGAGNYTCIVQDEHGCIAQKNVTINDLDGAKVTTCSTDSASCYGTADGRIIIETIEGGTQPYTYTFNNTPTTDSVFTDLRAGKYTFTITDAKACRNTKTIEIMQPDILQLTSIVRNPTCHNGTDGRIDIEVIGGNSGTHTIAWQHTNDSTLYTKHLSAGIYAVQVTDSKACQADAHYELHNPQSFTSNLPHIYNKLCKGKTMEIDAGEFYSYEWYKDAAPLSHNRTIEVSESGIYTLTVKDSAGCSATDTLELTVTDATITATMLVQDTATLFLPIEAIDITWPVPDSIHWFFNNPVSLYESESWQQVFSTDIDSPLTVTLRAWYGGCYNESYKTLYFYNDTHGNHEKSYNTAPRIKSCKAYPNPNSGLFTLGIELYSEAKIFVKLYSVSLAALIDYKVLERDSSYSIPYNIIGYGQGMYILSVECEDERQNIKILVK